MVFLNMKLYINLLKFCIWFNKNGTFLATHWRKFLALIVCLHNKHRNLVFLMVSSCRNVGMPFLFTFDLCHRDEYNLYTKLYHLTSSSQLFSRLWENWGWYLHELCRISSLESTSVSQCIKSFSLCIEILRVDAVKLGPRPSPECNLVSQWTRSFSLDIEILWVDAVKLGPKQVGHV